MEPSNEYQQGAEEQAQPNAYAVQDDDNLEEKDLRRTFLFGKGDEEKSGYEPNLEGSGAGGERFGESSETPSGDDPNNPSRNAGYTNEYFRRTEPLDESTTTNFKDPNQIGQPNYSEATGAVDTGQSDDENTAPVREENGSGAVNPQPSETEGATEDEDNSVAGYGETPEQQKVGGEGNTSEPGVADYKPEYDEGKPDYGSNSPDNK